MLGSFFTRPFVRLSLNTKIVNEVFDFEGGELIEEQNNEIIIENEENIIEGLKNLDETCSIQKGSINHNMLGPLKNRMSSPAAL